jgi:hypothetical protein
VSGRRVEFGILLILGWKGLTWKFSRQVLWREELQSFLLEFVKEPNTAIEDAVMIVSAIHTRHCLGTV